MKPGAADQILSTLRRWPSLIYNVAIVSPSRRVSEWSRWLLVATIIAMGSALLLTVWITYKGVGDASEALIRGQASALQADLRGEFRELRRLRQAPGEDDLKDIVDSYAESGLRYIALVRRKGRVLDAGRSEQDLDSLVREVRAMKNGQPEVVGRRVRMVLRAPAPRGARSRRRRAREGKRRFGPAVYIEFEPREAHALRASSSRSLATGAGASGLLLLVAIALLRWFRRQDRLRKQGEDDRRLKSLGQMSAILAHEIRNPLASLKGNAQILEQLIARGPQPEGKSASKAERVVSEATRLETLVNDLLDFARSGELHRAESDPAQLLQDCAEAIEEGELEVDCQRAPARWNLDSARMQQVLSNLLQNATQAGGQVLARASEEEGQLVYVIRDHGEGIDEGNAEALFEPFHTRKPQGTGLGLAVARRLVELHGGTITARNADGGGAEFRVEIPAG